MTLPYYTNNLGQKIVAESPPEGHRQWSLPTGRREPVTDIAKRRRASEAGR
ncbi:MAG: hypothetical protein ACSLE1_03175 [Sphingobium sp.]